MGRVDDRSLIMTKLKRTANIVIGALAGITLLNYTVYLIHLIAFPEQPLAFIITFCVIGAIVLPVIFRNGLRKIFGKAYPVLKGIWAACLLFYVVSFTVMTVGIFSEKETAPSELPEDTVLVVYGAKVNGTKEDPYPGTFLRYRLDRAAQIMKEAPSSVCIVCGGKGDNEPCAEADVMRNYLISAGIDPSRVFVDDKSENTIENIDNAMEIISENGLEDRPVACLTTDYHLPRVRFLCGREGLDADFYYSAKSPNFFGLWSGLVREYMSYGKLILTGHL